MKTIGRGLLILIILAILVILAMIYIPVKRTPAKDLHEPQSAITAERGEYVMRMADCKACHTAKDGQPFAGGLAIESQLGTIYSTNITPNKDSGIGNYSLDDFRAALYDGLRKDGKHIYPAMQYENYRFMSEADVQSLYKYMMEKVEPVDNTPSKTDLKFPFNQRWGLRAWNWLALKDPEFKQVSDNDEINRGAYLVEGPGHCGACHSPRTTFMTQDGLTTADDTFLTGGEVDGWSIPDLRGKDSVSAQWSKSDLAHYFQTGRNAHATAVGEMTSVIADSLQYATDEDAQAIAAYLKHISHSSDEGTKVKEQAKETDTQKLLTKADPDMPLGPRLYLDNCSGCHLVDGKGAPEIFPTLDGNPLVTADKPTGLIDVILHGAQLPSTEKRPAALRMQGYAWRLDDDEVAKLATFIRQAWHNDAGKVSAKDVAELRKN